MTPKDERNLREFLRHPSWAIGWIETGKREVVASILLNAPMLPTGPRFTSSPLTSGRILEHGADGSIFVSLGGRAGADKLGREMGRAILHLIGAGPMKLLEQPWDWYAIGERRLLLGPVMATVARLKAEETDEGMLDRR